MQPGTASAARCKVGDSGGSPETLWDAQRAVGLQAWGGFRSPGRKSQRNPGPAAASPAPMETGTQLFPDFPLQKKKT